MTATAAALKLEISVVTKAELLELADWELKCAKRKKEATEAEKEVKFRRIALAEKVLGIKSEDDLKELSPERLFKLLERRWEREEWKAGPGAPEFKFVKTSGGQYPSWQKLFVAELGMTAAARISTETPYSYSYKVEVTLP
jgi:hypothetical protein